MLGLAALAGAEMASACSVAAWTGGAQNSPTAGGPPTAQHSRFQGGCSLKSTAVGQTVTDNTPAGASEGAYRVQFYVKANVTGAEVDVFNAKATGGTNVIRVTYDGTNFRFYANTAASPVSVAATNNRWYQVQLNWARGSGTGKMGILVRGNCGTSATCNPVFNDLDSATPAITGLSNNSDGIDTAVLGWIAGAATGDITVDAFESRRATAIARICRDANGSGTVTPGDRTAITNELAGTVITAAAAAPDCNFDGSVTPGDRTCVTNLLAAFETCVNTP
ncbi:hypothetical protein C7S18_01935 [Ahniella affigens]|uniref:Dockerin domain-containing protein n=1 Tax=Ahniella affigens TaxID=2021234 RepID=A0A2P1PMF9_9GAMM|nr:hypothetical protein C7S18_01935 [Ahniella affigens]